MSASPSPPAPGGPAPIRLPTFTHECEHTSDYRYELYVRFYNDEALMSTSLDDLSMDHTKGYTWPNTSFTVICAPCFYLQEKEWPADLPPSSCLVHNCSVDAPTPQVVYLSLGCEPNRGFYTEAGAQAHIQVDPQDRRMHACLLQCFRCRSPLPMKEEKALWKRFVSPGFTRPIDVLVPRTARVVDKDELFADELRLTYSIHGVSIVTDHCSMAPKPHCDIQSYLGGWFDEHAVLLWLQEDAGVGTCTYMFLNRHVRTFTTKERLYYFRCHTDSATKANQCVAIGQTFAYLLGADGEKSVFAIQRAKLPLCLQTTDRYSDLLYHCLLDRQTKKWQRTYQEWIPTVGVGDTPTPQKQSSDEGATPIASPEPKHKPTASS